MTRTELLRHLKEFTESMVKDMKLPVKQQKEDRRKPKPRPPDVYCMRLVKSTEEQTAAPYIIHQVITGKDVKPQGDRQLGNATVRSVFSVYHDNEQEGSLLLLGLMERMRLALLKKVVIGGQFQLDLELGMEALIYPDDSTPFYFGEMVSVWKLPGIEREVEAKGR